MRAVLCDVCGKLIPTDKGMQKTFSLNDVCGVRHKGDLCDACYSKVIEVLGIEEPYYYIGKEEKDETLA